MLESGFKISDLKNIPTLKTIDNKSRIAYDNTFLLSYSHTVYGINYNRQNYKIPLTNLRDDLKGYIGVESLVAPWSEQIKLWHGVWQSEDANKSYVKVWSEDEWENEHYIPNKFSNLNNSYYIVKDIPLPFETKEYENKMGEVAVDSDKLNALKSINVSKKESDPYPDSNKIVTKKYVDERLSSKRLIEVEPEFTVRDYDCTYIIRNRYFLENENPLIKIKYPKEFYERALHNKLEFTLLIEGQFNEENNKWEPSISKNISWELIKEWDDSPIELNWLNQGNDAPPDLTQKFLYENSRYIVIRFESVTNEILIEEKLEEINDITVTKVTPNANFNIFGLCENLLYRRSSVNIVNKDDEILQTGTAIRFNSESIDIKSEKSKPDSEIIDITFESLTNVQTKEDNEYLSVERDGNNFNISFDKEILEKRYGNAAYNLSTNTEQFITIKTEEPSNEDDLRKDVSIDFNAAQLPTLELKKGETNLVLSESPANDERGIRYELSWNPLEDHSNTVIRYMFTMTPLYLNVESYATYVLDCSNNTNFIVDEDEEGNTRESLALWFADKINNFNFTKKLTVFVSTFDKKISSFRAFLTTSDIEAGGGGVISFPVDFLDYEIPIDWTMTNTPPVLKENSIYNITFTFVSKLPIPTEEGGNPGDENSEGEKPKDRIETLFGERGRIFARINWFINEKTEG